MSPPKFGIPPVYAVYRRIRHWPRTKTGERSAKLVADALEEDRRATYEEVSIATGAKMLQENAQ